MKDRIAIWAHRGASEYAPENTLPAFRLAEEQGADGIELDVQLTKDGELVVCHDERIDRCSDHQGFVRDYTLKELKSFSFSRQFQDYDNVRIPSLEEVLQLVKPGRMSVNIELKTGIFLYEGIEERVLSLVREQNMEERVLYSSFGHQSLMKIRKLLPEAPIAMLYADRPIELIRYAREMLKVNAIHPALYHLSDRELVMNAHAAGLMVNVWTVNEEAEIRECIRQGVDAIITNRPDAARRILEQST